MQPGMHEENPAAKREDGSDPDSATAALVAIVAERDGYRKAYQTVMSERDAAHGALSTMTSERDGYRTAFDTIQAERNATNSAVSTLTSERNSYVAAYQTVQAERDAAHAALSTMTGERDGYRGAYQTVQAERDAAHAALSTMTTERDGYRNAYTTVQAERDAAHAALSTMTGERDGYCGAYQVVQAERDAAHSALSTMTDERDGYRTAYQQVLREREDCEVVELKKISDASVVKSHNETVKQLRSLESLRLLQACKANIFKPESVFVGRRPPGAAKTYVVCNSIPKSGTYLLLELVKSLGAHVDVGYHAYSDSIRRLRPDGSFEAERLVPGLMWAQDLAPGYSCAAHLEYNPYAEQYFQTRADHKMILIIRDPRDLVISWVDFVYNSQAFQKMTAWNAYSSAQGRKSHPDDRSRIDSSIDSMIQNGLDGYYPWLNSPVCKVAKFEDLYGELTGQHNKAAKTPTLDGICDYLGLEKLASFTEILGRGLTASERSSKVGIYKSRMTADQLRKVDAPEFHRMVLELGYD
jgi:hypothetical protein